METLLPDWPPNGECASQTYYHRIHAANTIYAAIRCSIDIESEMRRSDTEMLS
jgi:hypothetical protein